MATLTQPASIDNYLDGVSQSQNHGASDFVGLQVEYGGGTKLGWRRPIMNFNLSAIPAGSIINAAEMHLEVWSTYGAALAALIRCTRPATWLESQSTWLVYRTGSNWTNAGGDYNAIGPPAAMAVTVPAAPGTWTITGLAGFVQDAVDNHAGILSIIMRLDDEDPGVNTGCVFRSTEYDSQDPEILVDYTPVGDQLRMRGHS